MAARFAPVVATALLVSCVGDAQTSRRTPADGAAVFVFMANGGLVRVAPASGRVEARMSLAPAAFEAGGRFLAVARGGSRVLALVPRGRGADVLVAVDAGRRSARELNRLDPAIRFRSIAVGTRSGRIYLAGNQDGAAVVIVLAPDGRRELRRWVARPAQGRSWWVYVARVSRDERLLYLSYHGAETSGADRVEVETGRRLACGDVPSYLGCLKDIHGNLEPVGDGVVATTGGEEPEVVRLDSGGRIVHRWNTRLVGNHLTEFALVGDRQLYALGSCGYTGGLSAVDLRTNAVRVLVRSRRPLPRVCGERVVPGPGGTLLVARTARPAPSARRRGSLLIADRARGRVARRIRLPAEPVDVLVVPRSY